LKISETISYNIKDLFLELGEILLQHIVPSAAAEATLQHPLPCPRHHKQWQIAPRPDNLQKQENKVIQFQLSSTIY
jgi:hypothetical protein